MTPKERSVQFDAGRIARIYAKQYPDIDRKDVDKVIEDLVHNKSIDTDYILFALVYASKHGMRIGRPARLYRLCLCREIREAFEARETRIKNNSIIKGFDYAAPKTKTLEDLFS